MPPRGNWKSEQDEQLWALYDQNTIDPYINSPDILWQHTQRYFPDFVGTGSSGKARAIRRLRDKNAIRRAQLAQAGVEPPDHWVGEAEEDEDDDECKSSTMIILIFSHSFISCRFVS